MPREDQFPSVVVQDSSLPASGTVSPLPYAGSNSRSNIKANFLGQPNLSKRSSVSSIQGDAVHTKPTGSVVRISTVSVATNDSYNPEDGSMLQIATEFGVESGGEDSLPLTPVTRPFSHGPSNLASAAPQLAHSNSFAAGDQSALSSAVAVLTDKASTQHAKIVEKLRRERVHRENIIRAAQFTNVFRMQEAETREANMVETHDLKTSQEIKKKMLMAREQKLAATIQLIYDKNTSILELVDVCQSQAQEISELDEVKTDVEGLRNKLRQQRKAFELKRQNIERRQSVERHDLQEMQTRRREEEREIFEIEIANLPEAQRRAAMSDFIIQQQHERVRQQKEAEQLRKIQLLRLQYELDMSALELIQTEAREDLSFDHKAQRRKQIAENKLELQGLRKKTEAQLEELKALQLKNGALLVAKQLTASQRQESKYLRAQQKRLEKARNKQHQTQRQLILKGEDEQGAADSRNDGASESGFGSSIGSDSDQEYEATETSESMSIGTSSSQADADALELATQVEEQEKEIQALKNKSQANIEVLQQEHKRKLEDMMDIQRDEIRTMRQDQESERSERQRKFEVDLREEREEQMIEMNELIAVLNEAKGITEKMQDDTLSSNRLLLDMLPPKVANLLKENKEVPPETYENVTIFFSDVCGFTSLSAGSTPSQVVELLNNMYGCFDSIIERHPTCYKVETIGDSYMIACGVPNDDPQHAVTLGNCALEILEAVRAGQIRIPQGMNAPDGIRIRVGLHSGPVMAGVVGFKMPRFCLFGDTVNTSSRMESTSLPMQIQISEATAALLSDTHVVEERGETEIKGKGSMKTFWLQGRK